MKKRVFIVDYGSQYCFLIGRRLRSDMGTWCEIITPNELSTLTHDNASAVILSGGPKSVYSVNDADDVEVKRIINDPAIPVLGICYGMQLIAKCLGGTVVRGDKGEYGHTTVARVSSDPICHGCEVWPIVWMSHQDVVVDPGQESIVTIRSEAGIAGFTNNERKCWAVQFHPEVSHTKCGHQILQNFLNFYHIEQNTWNSSTRYEQCKQYVQETVRPNDFVILGLSGGVDSMVCAALLTKLLPPTQWQAVLVDLGIMRQSEVNDVQKYCSDLNIPLQVVDRKTECYTKLANITDPEQKRKIIGSLFIDAFKDTSLTLKPTILCQGTIYPDVIESGRSKSGTAATIKSHHNVGGLPQNMGLTLLEPLRLLFKDEVRLLGLELGLPKVVVGRHPFPGPGLAIRIIGEVTAEKVQIVAAADQIFLEHIHRSNIYDVISQAYAGLLDCKAVGVVGDQRRYGWIICLRAICTEDFMTANVYPFTIHWLENVSTDIINKCPNIARVMYDITSKPPGTIELE